MKRLITLGFVLGLLVVGAYLTTQTARGVPLLNPSDPLPPDASVFMFTPDQRLLLLAIGVGVIGVTFGMGAGLAMAVRQLDKTYREAISEEMAAQPAHEYEDPAALGIHLPEPSFAPLIVGVGAGLMAVGIVVFPLLLVGLAILLVGIGAWAASPASPE